MKTFLVVLWFFCLCVVIVILSFLNVISLFAKVFFDKIFEYTNKLLEYVNLKATNYYEKYFNY